PCMPRSIHPGPQLQDVQRGRPPAARPHSPNPARRERTAFRTFYRPFRETTQAGPQT
ncbi:hypothetical protein C8T65DRAFT_625820, partial [Cerioporus squamosus]